ncbi:hypothetical protein C1646_770587 [Rhizophagus diaphanus]|nr:hypothetical protein C1646_770587 [Rhizophagus diaphanus] [Rhizophagus sp. MUCL 43196]
MANEKKDNNLSVDNPDTRKLIYREQEDIITKREVKNIGVTFTESYNKYYIKARSIKGEKSKPTLSYDRDAIGGDKSKASSDSSTTKDNKHHVAVCQVGEFVATYETIVQFKIDTSNFTVSQERQHTIIIDVDVDIDGNDEGKETTSTKDENFGWSIDISNVYTKDIKDAEDMKGTKNSDRWSMTFDRHLKSKCKYFIYVAVSRIVDKGLKSTPEKIKKRNGTTMIYRIELENENGNYKDTKNTIIYRISEISGICRFIHESKSEKIPSSESNKEYYILRRFIILNFGGIYSFDCQDNFKLYEKFDHPQCIKHELNALDSPTISDCINLLLSHIYDKYFLVENYKDNVQLLEVYNLEKMKLETITIRIKNSQDKLIRKYNRNNFSISKNKQLLCFTRGFQYVKLYFMENGLEAISKKFKNIEKIYLSEFIEDKKLLVIGSSDPEEKNLKLIIWDMYNFKESETPIELNSFLKIDNITTRLARIPGNILQIDDSGKVSSVLKEIEKEMAKKEKLDIVTISPANELYKKYGKSPNGKPDKSHIVNYKKNINFEPIVTEKEPWVLGDYERNSYCLYQNKNGSEIETTQLIVGRSTVQIWHQITSDDKNKSKDELPNKGEPFLEYILTNGIPVDQERENTRLRIEKFEYGSNVDKLDDFKLNDFCLKIYWYERVSKDVEKDDTGIDRMEKEKDREPRTEVEKDREPIIEMEKDRVKKKNQAESQVENKLERKVKVIQRQDIVDKVNAVRHACKALEFINKRKDFLENYKKQLCEEIVAYINRIIWRFIKYKPDDFRLLDVQRNVMKNLILGGCDHLIKLLLFGNVDDVNKANKLHIPRKTFWKKKKTINDDTEEHATDYVGWMSTVSKALPLLFKYNYDDCVTKLLRKNCFANQNYLTALKFNIISEKYPKRSKVNLHSNKISKWYSMIWKIFEYFGNEMYNKFEDSKDIENQKLALRVVPFPEFTITYVSHLKRNPFLNIILFLLIPRLHRISWKERNKLAIYLFITEVIQLTYQWRRYISDICNFFDILSIIFPVIVMSIMLKDFRFSDGFGSVETSDSGLIVLISFSAFFLWIDMIVYLRLIPNIAYYIYYVMIIIKPVLPFILFYVIVMIAVANIMYILFKEPRNIKIKSSTFSGTATNPANGQELNVEMKANFDPTDRNDNPFSYFPTAILAIYYRLNGDFVQRDTFDFWAIEVFSLITSIFLTNILRNTGVYEEAATKGRHALLRFMANQIANYEALSQVHFPVPKYIFYVYRSENFERWYEKRKNDGPIFSDFGKKSTFAKFDFEEKDYDKFSIWKYEVDIESEIEKFKIIKKTLNDNIEILFCYQKNDKKIDADINITFEKLNTMKNNLNNNIDNLITYFENKKNEDVEIGKFKTMKNRIIDDIDNLINQKDKNDDTDIKNEIEEFKTMNNTLNDNIEKLIKYFEDQKYKKNGDIDINIEIEEFKTMKNSLNNGFKKSVKNFEDQKNKKNGVDIKKEIENFKTMNNSLNDNVKNLVKYYENQKDYKKNSDIDIKNEIEEFKTMNNSLNDDIEKSIKYFEGQKNEKNENEIEARKKNLNYNIENLIKKLDQIINKNILNDK